MIVWYRLSSAIRSDAATVAWPGFRLSSTKAKKMKRALRIFPPHPKPNEEKALLAELIERVRRRIDDPRVLGPESADHLPAPENLTTYLFSHGFSVSEPRNYPEGAKIIVSSLSEPEKAGVFQGRTLRQSLLMAIEWAQEAAAGPATLSRSAGRGE